MRLPVLDTLWKALVLWARNLGFLTLVALFIRCPSYALGGKAHGDLSFLSVARPAMSLVLGVIFEAAAAAAVLTLFARKPVERKWFVAAQGVRQHTGQLVGVYVGVLIVSIAVFVPVIGLIPLFQLPFYLIIFSNAVLVILLKFALANPLVVAENWKAWPALKASWRMTCNRFVYVLGCYVISGVIQWFIEYGVRLLPIPWRLTPTIGVLSEILDTYWIILSWVMYVRIKEAGEVRAVEVDDAFARKTSDAPLR